MSNPQQLPLRVLLRDPLSFDNFFSKHLPPALLPHLRSLPEAEGFNFIYLWGGEGVGKSHLLHAAYNDWQRRFAVLFLSGIEMQSFEPDAVLEELMDCQVVCIDDVDLLAQTARWAEALFYLFNRLHADGKTLLVSAATPAPELPIKLADLRSRLSWGSAYQLRELDDEEKCLALQLRARQRGMTMGDDVAHYLLARAPRGLTELLEVLESLEKATLSAKRKLTLPFVKQTLGW